MKLTATAIGAGPLSYHWKRNGVALPGATEATLTLPAVTESEGGFYQLTASNAQGGAKTGCLLKVVRTGMTVTQWGNDNGGAFKAPTALVGVASVSAGGGHVLALKMDGSVTAWGENFSGQSTVPAALGGVVAVAAGNMHSVALRADGTVVAWGYNANGQTNVPAGLERVVAVAAGSAQTLALKADGAVVAWGALPGGVPVPADLSDVIAVAVGSAHSMALTANGAVVVWGLNGSGQSTVPTGLSGVVGIGSGWASNASFAWKSDGSLVGWGDNANGQTTIPLSLTGVVGVAAGWRHTLAIKADGAVVAWGENNFGQTNVPASVSGARTVAAGFQYSVAMAADPRPKIVVPPAAQTVPLGGTASFSVSAASASEVSYQWKKGAVALSDGGNVAGATSAILVISNLAAGDAGDYSVTLTNLAGSVDSASATLTVLLPPVLASRPSSRLLTAGQSTTVSINASGAGPITYQWMRNGVVLAGKTTNALTLADVTLADRGWYRLAASNPGGTSTAVFLVDVAPVQTAVLGWGGNGRGQLTIPTEASNAVAIAVGDIYSLAVRPDGTVVGWGDETLSVVPSGLTGVVAVAAGGWHSLALKSDGTVVAWGVPGVAAAVVPTGLTNVVGIAARGAYSMALKGDGTVSVWGGSGLVASVPTAVRDVVSISMGTDYALAVKSDGGVFGWGDDTFSRATVPAGLSGVMEVAAGYSHSVARTVAGGVTEWGNKPQGEKERPLHLEPVVAVGAGSGFSVALQNDGTVAAWGTNVNGQTAVPVGAVGIVTLATGSGHSLVLQSRVRPEITFQPQPLTINPGGSAVFAVTVSGGAPVTYRWRRNGVALPEGNGIAGVMTATLSITSAQAEHIGAYSVVVTGAQGTTVSNVVALALRAPVIVTPPAAMMAIIGQTVTTRVVASGDAPLSYQWYEGESGDVGLPVAGATSDTLTLAGLTESKRFWVRVSNSAGTANSVAVTALAWVTRGQVLGPRSVRGAAYANGRYVLLGLGVSADGTNWTEAVGAGSGKAVFGKGLYVVGGGSSLDQIFTSADGLQWVSRSGAQTSVVAQIIFDGSNFWAAGGGISSSPDGLVWTNRRATGGFGLARGGGQYVVPSFGAVATSPDGLVWTDHVAPTFQAIIYERGRFVALAMGSRVEAWSSADGAAWTRESVLRLPTGDLLPSASSCDLASGAGVLVGTVGRNVLVSDDGVNWTAVVDFLPATPFLRHTVTYGNGRFLIGTDRGDVWQSMAIPRAPTIASTMAVPYVVAGQSTTLGLTAAGPGLNYQWYRGTSGDVGQPIQGATLASYTPPAPTSEQSYWARLTNAVGSVDSETLTVRVASLPAIVASVRELEVQAGSTVTFTAQVTGAPVPTLQWYRGAPGDISAPVSGATTSVLTITAGGETARYWLRAANLAGAVDSEEYHYTPWTRLATYTLPSVIRKFGDRYVGLQTGAVGSTISTSSDARAWTEVATIAGASLGSIAFGAGLYAVSSHDAGLLTSPDLITWTRRALLQPDGTNSIKGMVIYAGGRFVATGNGRIFISEDGVSWSRNTAFPADVQISCVAHDGSRFVAVGGIENSLDRSRDYNGVVYSSAEGTTWTRRAEELLPDIYVDLVRAIGTVDFVGGKFIATSAFGNFVLVSSDGIAWSRRDMIGVRGYLGGVVYFSGRFLIPAGGSQYYISDDAIQWALSAGPQGMTAGFVIGAEGEIFASSGGLADGAIRSIFRSADGLAWQEVISTVGRPLNVPLGIAYGAGRFVATPLTKTSTDGASWHLRSPILSGGARPNIVFGQGRFVALRVGNGALIVSRDGQLWTEQTVSGITTEFYDLAATGGRLFAFSEGKQMGVSSDGDTWATVRDTAGVRLYGIAFGNGKYIGVGEGFATSPDGTTWTKVAGAPVGYFYKITFLKGKFIAAGLGGTPIYVSNDGLDWTPSSAAVYGAQLTDSAFLRDSVITVGNGYTIAFDAAGALWRRPLDPSATSIRSISGVQEIEPGATATVSVVASGPSLTYQWYRGETADVSSPIAGATQASFSTPPLAKNQRYWVRVTGPGGSEDSRSALVTVAGPPRIVMQPMPGDVFDTVSGNSTVSFPYALEVEVESKSPVAYQWYEGRSGDTLRPVSAAYTATLGVRPTERAVRYWVRVSNRHGSTDSIDALVIPWISGTFPTGEAGFSTRALTYGQGKFLATGVSMANELAGRVAESVDGRQWTLTASPLLGAVAFANGRFVAVALEADNSVYHSADRVVWTRVAVEPVGTKFTHLISTGDRFFALANNGRLATSTNGEVWTVVTLGTHALVGVAAGNGKFAVGAANGAVHVSADASLWMTVATGLRGGLQGILFGGGRFVAVGAEGGLVVSESGEGWVPAATRTYDNYETLSGVSNFTAERGRFFASGLREFSRRSLISADGANWSEGLFVECIAAGPDRFVATDISTEVVEGFTISRRPGKFHASMPEADLPVIAAQSAAQSVAAGEMLRLSVSAVGNGPFTYQWRKNGIALEGATSATFTVVAAGAAQTGTYVVEVRNLTGSVGSREMTVTVLPPTKPKIVVQPMSRAVVIGNAVTFSTSATGTAPLAYQWRKGGIPIDGATSASLTIANVQVGDLGVYRVLVSNALGEELSAAASLSATPAGVSAVHAVVGAGYASGGTVLVQNTLIYPVTAAGLRWQVLLPDGWSYVTSMGVDSGTRPVAGATGLAEWEWTTLPGSPLSFSFVLQAADGAASVEQALAALVSVQMGGTPTQLLAQPDPLTAMIRHSADTDRDGRIGLFELTRVIELYNARNGTIRTGRYLVRADTEDGFAIDPTSAAGTAAGPIHLHSADLNRDGRISLVELTRVIELFNTRSGTARTGAYRSQFGSEDGFAPGP